MDEIASFGEWSQERRNQLRLSRPALARQVGCSPDTIKKIERDERRPSTQIAELLAEKLLIPEADREDFIRRARGAFVSGFGAPQEMSLAEAQAPAAEKDLPEQYLPPQTTVFFGRQAEIAQINANLTNPNCRLLTILGVGGMGKTRLGIEVAATQLSNFTDGLVYVPLASIAGPDSTTEMNPLAGALADALKISFHGGSSPEAQLINYLKRKEMLLILDNFEHLLETAALVGDLLAQAPDIKIVVTSRERLNLLEEWRFPLEGLHFSVTQETQQAGADNSAVQLFGQRAQQLKPSFDLDSELPAVLQICRFVEGMPLALELAAAWIHQMPCAVIVEEIEAEIDFLTTNLRNIPERHRSMRAVFGYSWEKLTDSERDVLQNLSVFRGGFERNAAGVVTGASLGLLSGLVDKSLLSITEDGHYQIHELLRQFTAKKLAGSSVAENDALQHHSHFYITIFAEQEPKLRGPEGPGLITVFERDIDNIRVAIRRAVSHQPQLFDKPFGHTLWHFCEVRG